MTTNQVEPYVPAVVMSTAQACELVRSIDEAKRTVMREGTDYGRIPGVKNPTLLKPGAERLLQLFALSHRMKVQDVEVDASGRAWGVTVECEVTRADQVLGSCLGHCSYDEDRYFQSTDQRQAKENANAARHHREAATMTEPYRAPWNTLLKMAQKRALVGAALQVTGSSGLFSQDMEDEGTRGVEIVRAVCREIVKAQPKEARDALEAQTGTPSAEWGVEDWANALVSLGRILGPT